MRSTTTTLDLILRLAFFAIAPLIVFLAELLVPITGTLFNLAIAVVAFFFAETLAGFAEKNRLVAALTKRPLAFAAYYRDHPPRPFLYYVFYPLLFPYWLSNGPARKEFILYKGYTFASLGILTLSGAHQYFTMWRPELGPRAFGWTFVLTFVVDFVLVLMVLMPMATTIVGFHLAGRRGSLRLLLAVAGLSIASASAYYAHKRHGVVSVATAERMWLRGRVAPNKTKLVMTRALVHAWNETFHGDAEFVPEAKGEVEVAGAPVEIVRGTLGLYFRDDETFCFHLIAVNRRGFKRMLVLYGDPVSLNPKSKKQPMVWLALDEDGGITNDPRDLPKDGLAVMRRTALE
ncbi:MAG: hypothetical protein ACHREM_19110 [Polyangiales bacterium]